LKTSLFVDEISDGDNARVKNAWLDPRVEDISQGIRRKFLALYSAIESIVD
jgi:hypothetical protein